MCNVIVTTIFYKPFEICISITSGCDYYGMCSETFQFTGHKILGNNTAGTPINNYHIFHLITGIQFYCSCTNLTA